MVFLQNVIQSAVIALVVWAMLLATGCEKGTNEASPGTIQAGTVVIDTHFRGANLEIYASDALYQAPLASGKTDEEGHLELPIISKSGILRVVLSGGAQISRNGYPDNDNTDGKTLSSHFRYQEGWTAAVIVNEFTNVASGLHEYLVNTGMAASDAWEVSGAAFNDYLGVNIYGDTPFEVLVRDLRADTPVEERTFYHFLLKGLELLSSSLAIENGIDSTVVSSVYLSDVMRRDIAADGILDGTGLQDDASTIGTLAIGATFITPDFYTTEIARSVIYAAKPAPDEDFAYQIPSALIEQASLLAKKDSQVVGVGERPGLDTEAPIITIQGYDEQSYHRGAYTPMLLINDLTGIATLEVDMDGTFLVVPVFSTNGRSTSFRITTTDYEDGTHLLGIRSSDVFGNEAYVQYSLKTDNTGPFVTITSPRTVNKSSYTLKGIVEDGGIGVSSLGIGYLGDTQNVQLNDGAFEVSYILEEKVNSFHLELTDLLSNRSSDTVDIGVDRELPQFILEYSNARFIDSSRVVYNDVLSQAGSVDADSLYVPTDNAELNGTPLTTLDLDNRNVPYMLISVRDSGVSGNPEELNNVKVYFSYAFAGTLEFDNRELGAVETSTSFNTYILPLATEYLSSKWLEAAADDVHIITIWAVDKVGNSTLKQMFNFKVEFVTL